MIVSSTGCILTRDLPDPALDIPEGYKAARFDPRRRPAHAGLVARLPLARIDLADGGSPDRQSGHRRGHRALHPGGRAGARDGCCAVAEPQRHGSTDLFAQLGSSSSGLTNGGREVVNYPSSLSASYELDFWGKNRDAAQAAEETAIATRFDRDVVALTALVSVANAYFQVLAAQDRIRTAERNIASASASSTPSSSV